MPTITYDPILETTEPPRAAPPPGTALVLEPPLGEPLMLMHGEHVPARHVAGYRRSHLVDVANHGLRLEAEVPSRIPSFVFAAVMSFHCQVTNPVMVATNDIRDMTATVRPRLVKILHAVAQRYDVLDGTVVEAAMNSALRRYYGNSAVRLGEFAVALASPLTTPNRAVRPGAQ